MIWKKALTTQRLVNAYPLWAEIRKNEQSAGFQLLNSAGLRLDDLRRQQQRIGANYYLPTSIVSDIGTYYKFQLPRSYSFTTLDNDDSEVTFTSPTVSGLVDSTYHEVKLAGDNTVEDFWYNAIPTRASVTTTYSGIVDDHLVCSGLISQSPFNILLTSGIVPVTNHLTVTLSGANSCIDYTDGQSSVGLIQVDGTTRAGQYLTESLVFLHDDTQHTQHDFAEVSGVRAYGIRDADEAFLSVTNHRTLDGSLGEDIYYRHPYDLGYTFGNEEMPLFWRLSSTGNGNQHCLELHAYDGEFAELRLDGWVTRSALMQIELRDSASNLITPVDFAVEPWSNRIWVVDSENLYLFNTDIPFPSFKTTPTDVDYDAWSVIEPSSYTTVSGQSIDLDYVWRRPIVGLQRWRMWVEKPDGNKYSLVSGTESVYKTDISSWTYEEPQTRYIKARDTYTLDQLGDYKYYLQTQYTDGTSHVDKKIISVIYKQPEVKFSLSSDLGSLTINSIDIDSENKIWIRDSINQRHEITLHYDNMLIDIEKKVIYFREPYTQVRVWD